MGSEVTNDLGDRLRAMRDRELRRRQAEEAAQETRYRHEAQQMTIDRDFMLAQCRVGQPWEYAAWLRGYMAGGGEPDHFANHDTPRLWVALTHLQVRPLYGSFALKILVPDGITEDGADTGHTELFITDGDVYRSRGFHNCPVQVPVWLDTDVD
jgi:hypothetical protein